MRSGQEEILKRERGREKDKGGTGSVGVHRFQRHSEGNDGVGIREQR